MHKRKVNVIIRRDQVLAYPTLCLGFLPRPQQPWQWGMWTVGYRIIPGSLRGDGEDQKNPGEIETKLLIPHLGKLRPEKENNQLNSHSKTAVDQGLELKSRCSNKRQCLKLHKSAGERDTTLGQYPSGFLETHTEAGKRAQKPRILGSRPAAPTNHQPLQFTSHLLLLPLFSFYSIQPPE